MKGRISEVWKAASLAGDAGDVGRPLASHIDDQIVFGRSDMTKFRTGLIDMSLGLCTALVFAGSMATAPALAQESPSDGVYKDRVDWGILMDMSGPASASQGIWVAGFRDRVALLNENGGVNGRKLNLLVEDNRLDAATDKIAFEKLVSQTPVIAISGMGTSVSQVALSETIKKGKVPVIGTYTPTRALSEPVSKMVYNGFCSYRAMAQAGVGYFVEKLGLKNPKVMTVAIETAGGKEYANYVNEEAAKYGGTGSAVTMKATAADVTAQVQRIISEDPDFITIYGVDNTAILTMKALAQYGIDKPAFGITYLGVPSIYKALAGGEGENYYFVSCVTPGGADDSAANKELVAYAEKTGNAALSQNVNYVGGWVAGQLAAETLAKAGPDPTRDSLVSGIEGGFAVDTGGLAAPIEYTPEDHAGMRLLKVFGYDYDAKVFKPYGEYSDYEKYTK